jgi:streptogramin lyase
MSKTRSLAALFVLLSVAAALPAQTPTTIPAGISYEMQETGAVSGVRIDVQPDGSVWFLLPALDRIAVLRGSEIRQWQIRRDQDRGANPVDFEVDGDVIWFICNGESLIDAGRSIFGRLDTVTGQLREWIVPGSRPAGFYRAPDGKVWIPQTNQRLQSVDLTTLEVVDYRAGATQSGATQTIAYSDVVLGPDGALWMTDFGNNRIVRYVPGAAEETSWTFFDPLVALLNPSQIQFDDQGFLWISQVSGQRVDRFNPATNVIESFLGFANPIHFDLFGGRAYVTEADGGNGQVAVLEPLLAARAERTIEPQTLAVGSIVNGRRATIRDTTITPTTVAVTPETIPAEDLEVTASLSGILRTEIPYTSAYGIAVVGGEVWIGSNGRLAKVVLQTIGSGSDLAAPVATQLAGPVETEGRVDITLSNLGDTTIAGEALYLFSPGFFAARAAFTVPAGATVVLTDAFADLGSSTVPISGPVRIRVTSGPVENLAVSVRTAQARADGGSFGYSTPALTGAEGLGEGESRTLFTGGRESETSILGFYTPSGAEATFTLVSPDGTVRGTLPISIAANIAQEFQPAASAFGVAAEPGDVVRVAVSGGVLFPYVRIVDAGTHDVALSQPVESTVEGVFPNAGTAVGLFDTSFVSDLFLSNPDSTRDAEVRVAYYPLDPFAAAAFAPVTLPPGGSIVVANVLGTLFGVESGQGTLVVEADIPIASSLRVASRKAEGDFAVLALPIPGSGVVPPGGSATAIGVPQTASRRTNLILFNAGQAGVATVIAINGNGDETGRTAVAIGENRSVRLDSVMALLGVTTDQNNGRLVVEASEGMLLYAWTAEVDAVTGDVEVQPLRQ